MTDHRVVRSSSRTDFNRKHHNKTLRKNLKLLFLCSMYPRSTKLGNIFSIFQNSRQFYGPSRVLAVDGKVLPRIRTGRIRTGYFRSIWKLEKLRKCLGPQCHILYENSASSRNWELEYVPVLIRKVLIRGSSNAG